MSKLRFILFPLAILYGIVTELRNLLFTVGVLKSTRFPLPIISVGNLSTGGTGKTPHIIYLSQLLQNEQLSLAVLSRGYGRKTRGFFEVETSSNAHHVGDEPLLIKQQLPKTTVAVCESRVLGVNALLQKFTPNVVLLDDAYQHRYIHRSLNILLTDYKHLFCNDYLLPVGNLRELRKNRIRAHVIIVSKCPENLTEEEQQKLKQQLNLSVHQQVYFSSINYTGLSSVFSDEQLPISALNNKQIVAISSIAKPEYFLEFLQQNATLKNHLAFADHHNYTAQDVAALIQHAHTNALLVCTEKDAVKLKQFHELNTLPLYALTMGVRILNNPEKFEKLITEHVKRY